MTENERMKHTDTESAATPGTESMRPTQLTRVDTSAMEQNIRDINDAAAKQHQMSIDNAMRQEADAMKLAEREAAAQYAEQRRQTDLAERQALDNSALYAEARGDRGGVGQAQYNAIQATSAKNRADIQQAQTKMASEVTRQIAQMRRQGEYKKADALLSLSQQYLSQLNDLKRWETESNMTVDQANNALAQWQMNFEQAAKQADLEKALAEAGLTGMYNGQQTLAAQQFAADQAYRDKQLAMAQQEFDLNKALSEAGLTGMYNGQQTLAAQQAALEKALAEAGLTGVYNGQQTLAGQQAALAQKQFAADQAYRDQQMAMAQKEFDFNKALSEAGLTGMYNGQQTLAAQQAALEKALAEAGLTGVYNGQQTLEAQKMAADQAYRDQQFAADQAYRDQQMAMAQKEFDFNKALSEAGLTGMYNGQQTLEAQKMAADQAYRDQQAALEKALAEAGLTGMYNGQQTLEAQKMAADQAYRDQQAALEKALAEAGLTGVYNGQQTLEAQKMAADQAYRDQQAALEKALAEAGLTGVYNGQQTLDAKQAAADQAYRDQQMALAQQELAYNQNRDAVNDALNATKNTANQGWSVLELGVMPSAAQLSAMGLTQAQAQQYLTEAKALADATAQAQKIGDNSKVAALGWTALEAGIVPSAEQLAAMGVSAADAQAYINRNRQDIVIGSSTVGSGNGSSAGGSGQTALNPGAPTPDKNALSSAGFDALNAGRLPSDDQLAAMGWTKANAQAYIDSKKRVDSAKEASNQSQTQTSNQSKVDQIYQNALAQYRANGSLPSLSSLINRGLTNAEAQSVLDRLKAPTAATQTSTPNLNGNGNLTPTVNNVHADQMLSDTQSNNPISPSAPSTQTSNQSKVDQVYQNVLAQYRANGSAPSLSSLVNRGLTTAEAQSVLDRLKAPAATQTTQQRNSTGVADTDGTFISATDPRVVGIRTDSNGNTVYTLKDGRVLTDYTSKGSASTPSTTTKGSASTPSTTTKGLQTTAFGGGSGASTTVANADSTLGTLARLLGKIF